MPISNSTETGDQQTASDVINLWVPPTLIVIGTACNILVILAMRTRYFRSVSTSVYLRAGAFNDVLALLVSLTAHWLYVSWPGIFVRTDSSHIMCKFFNFYGPSNTDLDILITTVMTTERALVIVAPFGAAKCSPKRAWIATGCAITFVILKNFHFILSSDMVEEGRKDRLCDVFPISESYTVFWLDVWPWLNLSFYVICGFTIVISNCLIIHRVRKSAADKHAGGQKWRQLVPMLLSESFLLIILTFPFSFHLALLAIRLKYQPDLYNDPKTAATENLVFSITFYMLYSNKCANFMMYCATGSKFRDGLRMAVMSCFGKKESWRRKKRSNMYLSTVSRSHFHRGSFSKERSDEVEIFKTESSTLKDRNHYNMGNSTECLNDSSSCSSLEEMELTERTQPSVSVYM